VLYDEWWRAVRLSFVIASCVFKLYVVTHCHDEGGFQKHFCEVKLSWNGSARF
jgi:hypothetical protein